MMSTGEIAGLAKADADALELEVAERLTRAVARQDLHENKTENLAALKSAFATLKKLEYTDIKRVATQDGFVQQHLANFVRRDDGSSFDTPVCMVATVSKGRITRLDKYVDYNAIASIENVAAR